MSKYLGVLNFEPSYVDVAGLGDYRPISATSIFGRYRVVDFMMSNFTNSGIDRIKVHIKNRPRSLVEHISNTSYNINSKKGKIHMLHGEEQFNNEFYNNDLHAFKTYMEFYNVENPSYIIIAPSHFIFKQDFSRIIDYHINSKNDITVLYQSVKNADEEFLLCDALNIDNKGRIVEFRKNRGTSKRNNISLETYVMDFVTFKQLVQEGCETSSLYSLSDIISDCVRAMKIGAYQHHGYCACISTIKAYYSANMTIRKQKELAYLINEEWPIYTMTNDTCPTLYEKGAKVQGSIIANGCQIEGTVINSVIGRNVVIKPGAVIKDSIVLPDTFIDKNVKLDCAIVDRLAIVTHVKDLTGTKDNPIYINRGDRI
ncbi:MAG: glucose-1-phosphate adenylyltransferase subunit GlgD [Erysipelotrichaceae bacterium]|nr:glucose-1-phosphate adenylyltransferase subunit GlgD [Erysipelotrichaceae bacterium]